MRNKRVMIIGAGKSGKSTIAGWLDGTDGSQRRLANIRYGPGTIDIPGAYLECPWMHAHLIGSAADAFCVLMLVAQNGRREVYPPGFARSFRVPVLGVITGSGQEPEKSRHCEQQLERAGVKPPYYYVAGEEAGFEELKAAIMNYKK